MLRWIALVLLGLLTLHSASYGSGYLFDSAGMAQEFGANDPPSEAAENLTGLVGVLMLLMAAAAVLAIALIMRGNASGGWVVVALAVVTFAMGTYWATRGNAWDAGFYSGAATLLAALAYFVLRPSK